MTFIAKGLGVNNHKIANKAIYTPYGIIYNIERLRLKRWPNRRAAAHRGNINNARKQIDNEY